MRGNINNFFTQYEKMSKSAHDVSFAYAYEISLSSGQILRLNSSDFGMSKDGKNFLPFSSIKLVKGEFNDSAENFIILEGCFAEKGITKNMDLAGAAIEIYSYLDGNLTFLVKYFITFVEENDLNFHIKCEAETIKYNQPLLLLFSKTCRANFGDYKCGININNYKKSYKIEFIKTKLIILSDMDMPSGYYSSGYAYFECEPERNVYIKIISHHNNQIELEKDVWPEFITSKYISLAPNCDKNFITCCNKFNNAVNFRGEPTIAEFNFLKNDV